MTDQQKDLKALETAVDGHIKRFRGALGWNGPDHPGHPRHIFITALREGVSNHDPKSAGYAKEIMERLYLPERDEDLNHADRQRCLITILATRPERFPLALHVLFGMLEGIRAAEMRSIFFLVGTYTGIPGMISAIDLSVELFRLLEAELPPDITPEAAPALLRTIFQKTFDDFSPLAPTLQLVRALSRTTNLDEDTIRKALASGSGFLNPPGSQTTLAMSESSSSSKTR